jgi:NADH-quinone oxidoreductase subunit E
MEVPKELEKKADEAICHYPPEEQRSAALPLLHLVQQEFGFINDDAISWVADKLGVEPIKILELVTFYPGFRQAAPGKYHIRVCRTLSCAMAGCHQTMEKICEIAGIDRSNVSHHDPVAVSSDGKFSIEFAECLASCGTGPVCLIGDDFHEEVKPGNAKALLRQYK